MYRKLLVILAVLYSQVLLGQTASFDIQNTACIGEEVILNNSSINSESYSWDFCQDGLNHLTGSATVFSLNNSNIAVGTEIVQDSGHWYGFVSSRDNSKLLRLEFGTTLTSAPTVYDDYGNLGSPGDIKFYEESGVWYGLLGLTNNGRLLRLSFNNGLGSLPLVEDVGDLGSWGSVYGLSIVDDGLGVKVLVSSFSKNFYSVVDFGSSITNTPTVSDVLSFGVGNSLISGPVKLELLEESGVWYGFSTNLNNSKLLRMIFGSDLSSTPLIEEVTTITAAAGLRIVKDGGVHYGFVTQGTGGNLTRLKFSNGLSALPNIEPLGNLGGQLSNTWGLAVVKELYDWKGFYVGVVDKKLSSLQFEDQCEGLNIKYSTDFEPMELSYNSAGEYIVELTAIHANGNRDVNSQTITVVNATAPDITFTTENTCLESPNVFAASSTISDLSYSWDFNADGIEDSTNPSPTYQFVAAGDYIVNLTVSNGSCENVYVETVEIYNKPIADFTIPLGSSCTNTSINFTNTSNYDVGSPVMFSWDFNEDGIEDSSAENPSYTYNSTGNYNVRLTVSLPEGCSDTFIQEITLQEGSALSFKWTKNCFGEAVKFMNETVEDQSNNYSYSWNFGDDSGTSTVRSPSYTYVSAGNYEVNLTVDDGNCTSQLSQTLVVNDQPLLSMKVGEAIENVPISFSGEDLTLAGDSVVSWTWDFAGFGSATTQDTEFIFNSPGSHTISIEVTTAQECIAQTSNLLKVAESTRSTPVFSVTNEACLGEEVILNNSSINSESYSWDFCQDGLNHLTGSATVFSLNNSNIAVGTEIVQDSGHWYGFVSSRDNSKLLRLEFGTTLTSAPTVYDDYGNLGSPGDIKFYEESGVWYGLLGLTNNGRLLRLSFNNGLGSLPLVEDLGDLGSWGSVYGLSIVDDGLGVKVLVSSFSKNFYSVVDFGSSITNTPTVSDVLSFGVGNSLISGPVKLELLEESGVWYGFSTNLNNSKLLRMIFGSDLSSTPLIEEVTTITAAAGLRIVKDGGVHYGFVTQGTGGNLTRLKFSNGLSALPNIEPLGNLGGQLSNTWGLAVVKELYDWKGFYVGVVDKKLSSLQFEDQCEGLNIKYSTDFEPMELSYNSAGEYIVELTAIHANGNRDVTFQTITVVNTTAPDISFTTENVCIESPNVFAATSTVSDLSYSWDFNSDDIEDSNEQNPSYQFESIGTQDVKLVVQATNSCFNNTSQEIAMYPKPPTPSFELDTELLCSNAELAFNNLSDESAHTPEIISYLWDFDGEGTSVEANPAYTFSTGGTKQISLTMSIPGCESFFSQNVEVIAGPSVAFDFIDDCEGLEIFMNNQTTGDGISEYLWDFGDGFTNTTESPSHAYQSADDYQITLSSTNDMGCTNTLEKPITVYSLPSVAFSAEAGCENLKLQFTDGSLADNANITAWNWDFDGLGSATDQNPEFKFETAGEYEVTLSAETNFGCVETMKQTVTIAPSPVVDFIASLGCLNELTTFTDLTTTTASNPLTSWYWEIDGKIFTEQNPQYALKNSGTYDIALTVTPQNNCAIKINKEVYIENLPSVDFSAVNTCDNEFTLFTDLSEVETSPIISRIWDFAGLATANGPNAAFKFPQSGIYEVTLTVVNENGCSNSITKSVEIFAAPTAAFSVDVNFGAPPLEVNFTNKSTGADNYIWDFNDDANSVSSEIHPEFVFNEVKDYNVRLIAENELNCSDTTFAKIISTIPKLDLELVKIEPSLNNGKINLSLTISNSGTVRIDGFDITIELENSLSISESYSGSLNASEEIIYPLNFEIPSTSSNIDFLCIRLDDKISNMEDINALNNEKCTNFDQKIVIESPYPNPANDVINFRMILPSKSDITLSLLNIHGKTVYNQSFPNISSGLNTFSIDVEAYNTGMYFLKINTATTEEIKRIIKF